MLLILYLSNLDHPWWWGPQAQEQNGIRLPVRVERGKEPRAPVILGLENAGQEDHGRATIFLPSNVPHRPANHAQWWIVLENSPSSCGALLRKNFDTSGKTVHVNCFSDRCRQVPKAISQLLASAQAVLGCSTLLCQLCWELEGNGCLAVGQDLCIQHMMQMMITQNCRCLWDPKACPTKYLAQLQFWSCSWRGPRNGIPVSSRLRGRSCVQKCLFYLELQVHFSHGKNPRRKLMFGVKAVECWEIFALKGCMKFFFRTEMNLVCGSCFGSELFNWMMMHRGILHPGAM